MYKNANRYRLDRPSGTAEPVFRPELQDKGHEAERRIAKIENTGERRDARHADARGVKRPGLLEHYSHQGDGDQGEHGHDERPVPVIEAVDGKGFPAAEHAAAAAHGFRRGGQSFYSPGYHHGEDAYAVAQFLKQVSLRMAPAYALLGGVDAGRFFLDAGHHPEHDGKEQRQPGAYAPEQVDDLVRGEHRMYAGKPHKNRSSPYGNYETKDQRFEGHPVADEVDADDRDPEMRIDAVIIGK